MSKRKLRRAKKRLEALVTGIIAFLLASIAFWSFQEAVYEPLVNSLVDLLGEGPHTYMLLLVVSSLILSLLLKRKLPFVK